jgi:uridylate kinase
MLTNSSPLYKRVLLKISGEALMGEREYGIDPSVLEQFASDVVESASMGVQIGIVVGGGNIFRGVSGSLEGISRVQGDQMGMLATMINALALQNALESAGIYSRLMSAITMTQFAEPFIRRKAIRHLEKGRVVIFGCGTGNPFFTTDTAAALRAVEIDADAVLKGTRVDGIYDSDPEINSEAIKILKLSHMDVIQMGLRVMDLTAITLCQENNLPIVVFNMNRQGNLQRVLTEDGVGSIVTV